MAGRHPQFHGRGQPGGADLVDHAGGNPPQRRARVLLAYGKCGLPRVELFGAALASTLVNCAMFLAGLWFATMRRPFRNYHVLADLWQLDWPFLRQLIVIGTPISIVSLMQ